MHAHICRCWPLACHASVPPPCPYAAHILHAVTDFSSFCCPCSYHGMRLSSPPFMRFEHPARLLLLPPLLSSQFQLYGSGNWSASIKGNSARAWQTGLNTVQFKDGTKITYDLPGILVRGEARRTVSLDMRKGTPDCTALGRLSLACCCGQGKLAEGCPLQLGTGPEFVACTVATRAPRHRFCSAPSGLACAPKLTQCCMPYH